MRKTIRDKEPVRPSTKLATLQGEELTTTAKRRDVEPSKLLHQLRGDLDWIVKAWFVRTGSAARLRLRRSWLSSVSRARTQ